MKSSSGKRPRRVNLWHLGFRDLLAERGSPSARIMSEWHLPVQDRRVDFLLIRRSGVPRRDHEARSLRALWPRLSHTTLVELKSPSRPFRPSELLRLLSCGVLYHAQERRALAGPENISLVLIMPAPTPSLRAEIEHMRWGLEPLEPGYARIRGVMYTSYVAFTNEVADAEDDDFLRIFSEQPIRTDEASWWLHHWLLEKETMLDPKMSRPEGYDEMLRKFLERLSPEERLRGLSLDQTLLALPDEVLRGLSDEYLRSLPAPLQQAIRARLARR